MRFWVPSPSWDFSCQGLSHIAKFNFPSYQQYLVISWYFLLFSFSFQDSPCCPPTSRLLLSNLLCWFFLSSLTCVHQGPQGSGQELFFISLTALLLSFSPTALNAIRVLTTPRSLAGLLTPDSYIQRYVSISTWMSQTLYIQKRIPSNCSFHSLPDQILWSHPWLLFLTHLASHLSTNPIGSTFETYQESEYVSRLP